jgi:protein TonB
MMPTPLARWVLALLVALASHLVLAAWLLPVAHDSAEGTSGSPLQIALSGSSGGGGDGSTPQERVPSMAAVAMGAGAPVHALQALDPSTVAVQAAAQDLPPPIRATESSETAIPLKATEPPEPRVERARAAAAPPTPARRATSAKTTRPKTEATTAGEATERTRTPVRAGDSTSQQTGSGQGSPASAPAAATAGGSGAGGRGGGAASEGYYRELAAWLERHKRYPAQARKQRQEGVVRVRFVIDRNGRLISQNIAQSSGHRALDDAATDLLRRASPLPAIPLHIGRTRLEIVIPIAYRLQ